jgi:hypothetical protein
MLLLRLGFRAGITYSVLENCAQVAQDPSLETSRHPCAGAQSNFERGGRITVLGAEGPSRAVVAHKPEITRARSRTSFRKPWAFSWVDR